MHSPTTCLHYHTSGMIVRTAVQYSFVLATTTVLVASFIILAFRYDGDGAGFG